MPPTIPLWFKSAIIYELHVRAFFDSNGDGKGDIQGLITKLPYLQRPGGELPLAAADVPEPAARRRLRHRWTSTPSTPTTGRWRTSSTSSTRPTPAGFAYLTELVVNHTSDQHPWFQEARSSPGQPRSATGMCGATPTRSSKGRGSSSPTPSAPTGPGTRWPSSTTGTASSATSPTSTTTTPRSRKRCSNIMRFWLRMGVDGFRLRRRALPLRARGHQLREPPGDSTPSSSDARGHHRPPSFRGRVLLAEANQWPSDVRVLLRRRGRVPHGVPLPGDALHLHGGPARGAHTRSWRSWQQTPEIPEHLPVGASSSATTTSSRWRW